MLKITITDTETGAEKTYAGDFMIMALNDPDSGGVYGFVNGGATSGTILKALMTLDACRRNIFRGRPELALMYERKEEFVQEEILVDLNAMKNRKTGGGEA